MKIDEERLLVAGWVRDGKGFRKPLDGDFAVYDHEESKWFIYVQAGNDLNPSLIYMCERLPLKALSR